MMITQKGKTEVTVLNTSNTYHVSLVLSHVAVPVGDESTGKIFS